MRLTDTKGAARFLKLQPATLAQWRWRGVGPPFRKLGAAVRYDDLRDLHDYVEQQARSSTSDIGTRS